MSRRPAHRPPTVALTAAAGLAAALLLAGCSSAGTAAPGSTGSTGTTTSSAAGTTSAAAPTAQAACTTYAANTGNPRQVVLSASRRPVLGPAVALVVINFRNTISALEVPSDPQLSAAFSEVGAAIDELDQQLTDGLPEGADPTKTPVQADPTRLAQALDDADSLCAAQGVVPKSDTASTEDPSRPATVPGATSTGPTS